MLLTLSTWAAARAAVLAAVTEIGTSWRFCWRRWAVTTTSSTCAGSADSPSARAQAHIRAQSEAPTTDDSRKIRKNPPSDALILANLELPVEYYANLPLALAAVSSTLGKRNRTGMSTPSTDLGSAHRDQPLSQERVPDLARYTLQPLQRGVEFDLFRGCYGDPGEGSPASILVRSPLADPPSPASL